MRISRKQKEIIKVLGSGAMLAAGLVAPNILKLMNTNSYKEKYRAKRSLQNLIKEDVIFLSGEKIKLSPKGKELFKIIQSEDVIIKSKEEWNGIWHLVCYDIPEKRKKERDYFRSKLTRSGFHQIQDSMWVFPYDCKEEIAVIAQSLGISPGVAYLKTDYLPQQSKLIKHFNLDSENES